MRLWTLHPRYLDRQGLLALWREGLLARAVLHGQTRGYRHHPQLERFRAQPAPELAIDAYLAAVQEEATARGYRFDRSKLGTFAPVPAIVATQGQLDLEWQHLLRKLAVRDPLLYDRWRRVQPACHPIFQLQPGPIASLERRQDGKPASGSPTAFGRLNVR